MSRLREKSIKLTGYLEKLLSLLSDEIHIFTPTDVQQRGSQLSITFKHCDIDSVHKILKENGVICDIRKPNVMRVAPAPLYNSYHDVWKFVTILKDILQGFHTVATR